MPLIEPLLWLHVFLVPLQGAANAVVYGGLVPRLVLWIAELPLPAPLKEKLSWLSTSASSSPAIAGAHCF